MSAPNRCVCFWRVLDVPSENPELQETCCNQCDDFGNSSPFDPGLGILEYGLVLIVPFHLIVLVAINCFDLLHSPIHLSNGVLGPLLLCLYVVAVLLSEVQGYRFGV